jgi:sarcosine oxidase
MSIHGGLMIGPPDGDVVRGTIRSATEHRLPHEILSPREVHARFPAFELPSNAVAVFDPHAGILDPDACNRAHIQAARAEGADIRFDEPAQAWEADGAGVTVRTALGFYRARNLVLTAGPWMRELVRDLALPLTVERQVLFWFDIDRSREEYARDHFPIYAYQHAPDAFCYGFPRLLRGSKAAVMHRGRTYDSPDDVDRDVDPSEVDALRDAIRPILPVLADAPVKESMVCLFTNTPDHDFLIDRHPHHPQVVISSPCSGHGFKFASAIGEAHADLILEGHGRVDLSPFRISRFGESVLKA